MYYVYILTNVLNTVLYIGFTSDLTKRIYEHINGSKEGFTSKYRVNKLVYVENFAHPDSAIAREKQLKSWTREKKNKLVESQNPEWEDIFNRI